MNEKLPWESFDALLDESQRRDLANSAKMILETSLWQNERNRLIDAWIRNAACTAQDFEQVNNMRMCINALILFEERLKEIAAWAKPKSLEENEEFAGL